MTSARLAEARAACDEHRAAESARPKTLFDAAAERDQAVASVVEHNRGDLLNALDAAVERVAASFDEFTADDLRDELMRSGFPTTADLRVVGGVLRRAAQRGLIRAVGFAPSRYRHASPVRVWQSRVR